MEKINETALKTCQDTRKKINELYAEIDKLENELNVNVRMSKSQIYFDEIKNKTLYKRDRNSQQIIKPTNMYESNGNVYIEGNCIEINESDYDINIISHYTVDIVTVIKSYMICPEYVFSDIKYILNINIKEVYDDLEKAIMGLNIR